MRKQRTMLAVLILAVMLTVGCAHKVSTNGQPAPPVTPYEQVLADNASLATTNNAIAKGAIALQRNGQVTAAQIRPLLDTQERIAQADIRLSQILALGPDAAAGQSDAITQIIAAIRQGAVEISGGSDPNIVANAKHVESLADSLVSGLKLARVLK